MKRILDMTQK